MWNVDVVLVTTMNNTLHEVAIESEPGKRSTWVTKVAEDATWMREKERCQEINKKRNEYK